MTKEELAKLQHEADVQNFNEWFLEVRWKVNLMAEYGYGTREALDKELKFKVGAPVQ